MCRIVFAQHIKVAISRFDGQVQRLRFTLGDTGLIPTTAAARRLGQPPVRMADRLTTFLGLLTDLDVIEWSQGAPMAVSHHADLTLHQDAAYVFDDDRGLKIVVRWARQEVWIMTNQETIEGGLPSVSNN